MTTDAATRARLPRWALGIPSSGLALALGGIALVQLGAIAPMGAFLLFVAGSLLGGGLGLLLGATAALRTRSSGPGGGFGTALSGASLGACLLFVLFAAASPGSGLPSINDISTDLEDPPGLSPRPGEGAAAGAESPYPAAFVPQVRAAYADLSSIHTSESRDRAYRRALDATRSLGWQVVQQWPQRGEFEATDTSRLFRFVDDVRVRVRGDGSGSHVDLRSRSRDGRGDLGANAARIRSFREHFEKLAAQRRSD